VGKKSGIIRLLSTKEKVILTLTASGISDPEISQTLGLKQNNIRQFRIKALKKLREY
jgi:DNA-binding NarL/FixJ family response regulator